MISLLMIFLCSSVCAVDKCLDRLSSARVQRILGVDVINMQESELKNPSLLKSALEHEASEDRGYWNVIQAEKKLQSSTDDLYKKIAPSIKAFSGFDRDVMSFSNAFLPIGSKHQRAFLRIAVNAVLRDVENAGADTAKVSQIVGGLSEKLHLLIRIFDYVHPRLVFIFSASARPHVVQDLVAFKEGRLIMALGPSQENIQGSLFADNQEGFLAALMHGMQVKFFACRNMSTMNAMDESIKAQFVDEVFADAERNWSTDGLMRLLLCHNFLQSEGAQGLLSWPSGKDPELFGNVQLQGSHDAEIVGVVRELSETPIGVRAEKPINVADLSQKYVTSVGSVIGELNVAETQRGKRKSLGRDWRVEVSGSYRSYQGLQRKVVERICALERQQKTDNIKTINAIEEILKRYLWTPCVEKEVIYASGEGPTPFLMKQSMGDRVKLVIPTYQELENMGVSTRRGILLKFIKVRDCALGVQERLTINPYGYGFFAAVKKHCLFVEKRV